MREHLALNFILIMAASVYTACSTSLTINSSPPKCSVSVLDPKTNAYKELGVTPLTVDIAKVKEITQNQNATYQVSMKGFYPRYYIIPSFPMESLTLEALMYPNTSDYLDTNRIISKLFLCQRSVRENRLDEGLKMANTIIETHPNVALAYEMIATIYFLQREYKKSYDNWVKAIELQPESKNAQKMVEILDKIRKKPDTPNKPS